MQTLILAATRTPIGSFQGGLRSVTAPQLGSIAIREAVHRSHLDAEKIENVIMGCVLTAGLGQSPARQAALGAGCPNHVGALTVNKVCSSGLVSVMLADQIIRAGDAGLIVAGGMESMSNAPYLLPQARAGFRLGDASVIDSVIFDGLLNASDGVHMGTLADHCAAEYNISRAEQDAYAVESYRRAQHAISSGAFHHEMVPVQCSARKGEEVAVTTDEEPSRIKFDKVATLRPTFSKEGTVTVANASSLSDGAAAVIVASAERARELGAKPLARILAHAAWSQEPERYTTAPAQAIKTVLQKAGLKLTDIDLFEINEAFAVVTLATMRELNLDHRQVNVNGGAVALGHPIGASGARLLATLLAAMQARDVRRGLVALCNGGGEATAMIVERVAS